MPFDSHLIHTCTVQANTPTQHSSGAETEGWADETTGQACRLIDKRGFKPMEDIGRQVQFDKIGLFPAGTTIDTERRVKDFADADGNTIAAGPFEIISVSTRRRGSPHHISAELRVVS